MKEYDYVRSSRLRLNLSCKEHFHANVCKCVINEYFYAILNPVFASKNTDGKIPNSASSAAYCIDGPACSSEMRFASLSAISRIGFFSSGAVDGTEMY